MIENRNLYKEYPESKLHFNVDITEEISIDNLIFLFFQPEGYENRLNDERLGYNTNLGPLMIDIETGKYEIMSAVDFSHNYGDRLNVLRKDSQTIDSLIFNIDKRKRINWSDFEELFRINKFDLFENVDMYSNNPLVNIEFEINKDITKELILNFLNQINANYTLSNNHIIVNVDII